MLILPLAAGCVRLFDMVKVSDPKLLKAFFYAMGNTLVAKDMDQASRIAYAPGSAWRRVVTIKVSPLATWTSGLWWLAFGFEPFGLFMP